MSTYQRFFIKTRSRLRVEKLIIDTLGGDGWLMEHGDGYLRPITVTSRPGEAEVVYPKRDKWGTPVTEDAETGWFWLSSQIAFSSQEAAEVANALLAETKFKYPLVEMIAVDTDAEDDEGAFAVVITDGDALWYR